MPIYICKENSDHIFLDIPKHGFCELCYKQDKTSELERYVIKEENIVYPKGHFLEKKSYKGLGIIILSLMLLGVIGLVFFLAYKISLDLVKTDTTWVVWLWTSIIGLIGIGFFIAFSRSFVYWVSKLPFLHSLEETKHNAESPPSKDYDKYVVPVKSVTKERILKIYDPDVVVEDTRSYADGLIADGDINYFFEHQLATTEKNKLEEQLKVAVSRALPINNIISVKEVQAGILKGSFRVLTPRGEGEYEEYSVTDFGMGVKGFQFKVDIEGEELYMYNVMSCMNPLRDPLSKGDIIDNTNVTFTPINNPNAEEDIYFGGRLYDHILPDNEKELKTISNWLRDRQIAFRSDVKVTIGESAYDVIVQRGKYQITLRLHGYDKKVRSTHYQKSDEPVCAIVHKEYSKSHTEFEGTSVTINDDLSVTIGREDRSIPHRVSTQELADHTNEHENQVT